MPHTKSQDLRDRVIALREADHDISSHKRARTIRRIQAMGATVAFLPPYSPDYNPIENVFSKIKRWLRSLACRTREQRAAASARLGSMSNRSVGTSRIRTSWKVAKRR